MAAPAFKPSSDINQLVISRLSKEEADIYQATSRDNRDDKKKLFKRLQLIEWSCLLQNHKTGKVPTDFRENEKQLKNFYLATFPMTKHEEVAWRTAYDSIQSKPPILSQEEKEDYLKRYAPIYAQLIGLLPRDIKYDEQYYTEMKKAYVKMLKGSMGDDLEIDCISQPIFLEGSFHHFLEVFAIDGERYNNEKAFNIGIIALRQMMYNKFYFSYSFPNGEYKSVEMKLAPEENDLKSKRALLVILALRASAFGEYGSHGLLYNGNSEWTLTPILDYPFVTRALILSDFDFTVTLEGLPIFQHLFELMKNGNDFLLMNEIIDSLSQEQLLSQLQEDANYTNMIEEAFNFLFDYDVSGSGLTFEFPYEDYIHKTLPEIMDAISISGLDRFNGVKITCRERYREIIENFKLATARLNEEELQTIIPALQYLHRFFSLVTVNYCDDEEEETD